MLPHELRVLRAEENGAVTSRMTKHNAAAPLPAWLGWLATAIGLALDVGLATHADTLALASAVALLHVGLSMLILGLRR